MFSWLLVNVVLSVMAWLFIMLNATAPHRLRFQVCFAALLAWLVPWHLMPEFLPQWHAFDLRQIERELAANAAEYTLRPIVIIATDTPVAKKVLAFTMVQLGFMTLCASGFFLFCGHLCRHYMCLSQLRSGGEDGAPVLQARGLASPVPVIIQSEISGAFSSGLLKPRIWIHKDLAASAQLATLLQHELTHIRQLDNWYLLLITFIEKLFWWNPLVWLLGRQARELQELSCDALCQRASADYPLHLAELMIDSARLKPARSSLLLSANIFTRANLNIKRIKILQRSYPMKARHLVSTVAVGVCAIAAIGLVTAQPKASEEPTLVLSINAEGMYFISLGASADDAEAKPVPLERIGEDVAKIMNQNPAVPVFLEADAANNYGVVMSLLSILEAAGASGVRLITQPATAAAP